MQHTPKLVFYGVKPHEEDYLSEKLPASGLLVKTKFVTAILEPGGAIEHSDAEIISVFVDSVLDEKVLGQFPNLKFVAIRSTGYDNVDLAAAKKRGIAVSNVPAYGENTVAEFAFALMLALSRKICTAVEQVKEAGNFNFENLQGFDLKGKTLGVVGTGRIGRQAIKMASGLDMKVVACDPHPDLDYA